MVTIDTAERTSTVPAGWYPDPGQSGSMRWWNGQTWTAALQATPTERPTLPSVPTVDASKPLLNSGAVTGVPSVPATAATTYAFDPRPAYNYSPTAAPVERGRARSPWTSFGLGALGLVLVIAHIVAYPSGWYVGSIGVIAVIGGVRALSARRGSAVPAVLGIVLGGLASLLMVASLLGMFSGLGGSFGSSIGMTDQTSSLPAATPSVVTSERAPLTFPHSATLTAAGVTAKKLESAINHGYTKNHKLVAPASMVVHPDGQVVDGSGHALGVAVPAGDKFAYIADPSGASYRIVVADGTGGFAYSYTSSSDAFVATCPAASEACSQ